MKKLFFLAPLALAVLASCSNSEEPAVEASDATVNFSATIDGKSHLSRASETSWDANDAIGISGVSGSKTYTNVKYVTASGDGNFSVADAAQTIYYQSNATVTFTAYWPWIDDANLSSGVYSGDVSGQGYPKIFDFLWSQETGSKNSPNVAFKFNHKMSKVVVTLKGADDVSYDELKAARMYFSGVHNKGEFNTVTGEAKATGNVSNRFVFANDNDMSKNCPNVQNDADKSITFTLIMWPQAFSSNVIINAEQMVSGSVAQTFSAQLDFTQANQGIEVSGGNSWEAGRQYNVTLTLHKTKLTANECTIEDWEATTSSTAEAY